MCRWITLLSTEEVALADVVLTPQNSLIQLSKDASFHPGYSSMNNHVMNGDGFGYVHMIVMSLLFFDFQCASLFSNLDSMRSHSILRRTALVGTIRTMSSLQTSQPLDLSLQLQPRLVSQVRLPTGTKILDVAVLLYSRIACRHGTTPTCGNCAWQRARAVSSRTCERLPPTRASPARTVIRSRRAVCSFATTVALTRSSRCAAP